MRYISRMYRPTNIEKWNEKLVENSKIVERWICLFWNWVFHITLWINKPKRNLFSFICCCCFLPLAGWLAGTDGMNTMTLCGDAVITFREGDETNKFHSHFLMVLLSDSQFSAIFARSGRSRCALLWTVVSWQTRTPTMRFFAARIGRTADLCAQIIHVFGRFWIRRRCFVSAQTHQLPHLPRLTLSLSCVVLHHKKMRNINQPSDGMER